VVLGQSCRVGGNRREEMVQELRIRKAMQEEQVAGVKK
jgi:hypothetical protein